MALAETGIVFHANDFELERCEEQRQLCLELISEMSNCTQYRRPNFNGSRKC